jgi:hypothetical protein
MLDVLPATSRWSPSRGRQRLVAEAEPRLRLVPRRWVSAHVGRRGIDSRLGCVRPTRPTDLPMGLDLVSGLPWADLYNERPHAFCQTHATARDFMLAARRARGCADGVRRPYRQARVEPWTTELCHLVQQQRRHRSFGRTAGLHPGHRQQLGGPGFGPVPAWPLHPAGLRSPLAVSRNICTARVPAGATYALSPSGLTAKGCAPLRLACAPQLAGPGSDPRSNPSGDRSPTAAPTDPAAIRTPRQTVATMTAGEPAPRSPDLAAPSICPPCRRP